jgi:hypothetical protein
MGLKRDSRINVLSTGSRASTIVTANLVTSFEPSFYYTFARYTSGNVLEESKLLHADKTSSKIMDNHLGSLLAKKRN